MAISVDKLGFADAPNGGRRHVQLSLSDAESRAVSGLVYEMAGRLEREKKPAARKQAERYREIAREIRGFGE